MGTPASWRRAPDIRGCEAKVPWSTAASRYSAYRDIDDVSVLQLLQAKPLHFSLMSCRVRWEATEACLLLLSWSRRFWLSAKYFLKWPWPSPMHIG